MIAGLPFNGEALPPSLFSRAAQRAGLTSKLVVRELHQLNNALFPVVLLLDNNDACLLLSLDDEQAQLVFPELGETQISMPRVELAERFSGRAIYARPQQRIDTRNHEINKQVKGHWFWSVIRAHRNLYRDVLLAAFLINLFALAMPLFVMNVYDRVVPNHATESLWVLAIGVLVVLCADLVLRVMRSWFVDLAASRADVRISSHIMEHLLNLGLKHRPASVGSFANNVQSFESVRAFMGSMTVIALVDQIGRAP